MVKGKIILFTMIMLLLKALIIPIYSEAFNYSDVAYNNGKTVGESHGKIAGKTDYINEKRSNWRRVYDAEEEQIIEDYNLNEKSRAYQYYFLKGFKKEFEIAYKNEYRGNNSDTNKTSYEIGVEHGERFGAIDGETYGKKNYYDGKNNDWESQLPSESYLRKRYSLNNDSNRYRDGFLFGYKIAFEEWYTSTYRDTNVNSNMASRENGIMHGMEIGFKLGSVFGEIDFIDKKSNDWESAIPSNDDIVSKYNLNREIKEYRYDFLIGFKNGFHDGYIESFQDKNMNFGKANIKYDFISNKGGRVTSNDGNVELYIKPGTIYNRKYISIQEADFPSLYGVEFYTPASNRYIINIENELNTTHLHNSIMLTFKYYGSERSGIYELVNNKWRYLYSNVSNGEISTKLDDNSYKGGTYAILVDDNYKELKDIHINWAGQEIYTYLRRDYIAGYNDGTFRPESNITRAEFMILLSRVLDWDTNINHNQINKFNDYNTFGLYGDVIAKATSIGLINGYSDNTFKPNNSISYQEVEWIMQRVLNKYIFNWNEVENKMMYEKYTRSKSFESKENNITRAEVVYMLYNLQNENKI